MKACHINVMRPYKQSVAEPVLVFWECSSSLNRSTKGKIVKHSSGVSSIRTAAEMNLSHKCCMLINYEPTKFPARYELSPKVS